MCAGTDTTSAREPKSLTPGHGRKGTVRSGHLRPPRTAGTLCPYPRRAVGDGCEQRLEVAGVERVHVPPDDLAGIRHA